MMKLEYFRFLVQKWGFSPKKHTKMGIFRYVRPGIKKKTLTNAFPSLDFLFMRVLFVMSKI